LRIFQNRVEKIKVLLTSDKDNRHCTCRPKYTYDNMSLFSS